MSVNKYKIVKSTIGKQVDIPIEFKWDFTERDQAIDTYQGVVLDELIGLPNDFELSRFTHTQYLGQNGIDFLTKINYDFNFFDTGSTINNQNSWKNSYLFEGFTKQDVYYYSKPFTKSFFKLDFYDTKSETSQKNYFSVILPVQQGDFETVTISTFLQNVQIRKPKMGLDFIGDKEGFFIYWLRENFYIDIDEFYMSAKFFNARLGVFVSMMNRPQSVFSSSGNYYTFNKEEYFYYRVKLDYPSKTYKVFDTTTGFRVGTDVSSIKWYEYLNP
jgi:hypothetical protein